FPIFAASDRSVAVLFGLACNASHNLSSVSVRAFATVGWSGTGRRIAVEPVVVALRVLRVRVLLDMTSLDSRFVFGGGYSCPGRSGCGPRCAGCTTMDASFGAKSKRVRQTRWLSCVDGCCYDRPT